MNCDCIKKMENMMADFHKEQAGDNVTAACQVAGFTLGKTLTKSINIPFRVKGRNKGFTSLRGKEVMFIASYCPFCGVRTRKSEEA